MGKMIRKFKKLPKSMKDIIMETTLNMLTNKVTNMNKKISIEIQDRECNSLIQKQESEYRMLMI